MPHLFGYRRLRTLCAIGVVLVAANRADLWAQHFPHGNVIAGDTVSVSNRVLTIVTDRTWSVDLPKGTKLTFVVNNDTRIVSMDKPVAASDIQKYHRVMVQFVERGGNRIATNLWLSQPVRASMASRPAGSSNCCPPEMAANECFLTLNGVFPPCPPSSADANRAKNDTPGQNVQKTAGHSDRSCSVSDLRVQGSGEEGAPRLTRVPGFDNVYIFLYFECTASGRLDARITISTEPEGVIYDKTKTVNIPVVREGKRYANTFGGPFFIDWTGKSQIYKVKGSVTINGVTKSRDASFTTYWTE